MLNRIERYLIPGIALGIAVTQFSVGGRLGLSQWKGGGYGMFSTVDSPDRRSIRCVATLDGGENVIVSLEGAGSDLNLTRLKALPSESGMQRIADRVFERGLQAIDSQRTRLRARIKPAAGFDQFPELKLSTNPRVLVIAPPGEASSDSRPRAVTVEILRLTWNAESRLARLETILAEDFHATNAN